MSNNITPQFKPAFNFKPSNFRPLPSLLRPNVTIQVYPQSQQASSLSQGLSTSPSGNAQGSQNPILSAIQNLGQKLEAMMSALSKIGEALGLKQPATPQLSAQPDVDHSQGAQGPNASVGIGGVETNCSCDHAEAPVEDKKLSFGDVLKDLFKDVLKSAGKKIPDILGGVLSLFTGGIGGIAGKLLSGSGIFGKLLGGVGGVAGKVLGGAKKLFKKIF